MSSDLALFGAVPAFAELLHVGRPNIGDRARLLERINDILDRRWFTNGGPYENQFEARLASLLGVRHCIAVASGTVALELAIRAAGLSGEVILPSFTFVATAHALQWQGITPVFCDIDPLRHTLDPEHVEALITPRTSGIIGVHLWGRTCDVESLDAIAARHKLVLLFDAAHALGCTRNGRPVGAFGQAETFSFHATKFVNSFEGGAVATNDEEFAHKLRLLRNFGFVWYDEVDAVGTNAKLNEVSAAMGLTSLESFDDFVRINRENLDVYRRALAGIPGVALVGLDAGERHNYQYVVLEIDEPIAGLSRDELLEVLWQENILARRYFYPGCHNMSPYRRDPPAHHELPHTERLASRDWSSPPEQRSARGGHRACRGGDQDSYHQGGRRSIPAR